MRVLTVMTLGLAMSSWAIPAIAAGPTAGSTTLSFEYPQGTAVSSVGLNGVGADVYIKSTTSSAAGQPYIDDGSVMLQIATDGSGNPTSAALNSEWVRIDQGQPQNPVSGVAYFAVDLDNLSTLGITDSSGDPLQDVTCSNTTIGFRVVYTTGGGQTSVATHFSAGTPLTIECSACGQSTDLTIGIQLASGNGSPLPGDSGPWSFRVNVQNCTGYNLTGVKAQGGTNGWAPMTNVQADAGSVQVRNNNKNQVVTWTGDLANAASVNIDVTVNGTIKPNAVCTPVGESIPVPGSVLFLSGPWSATYSLNGAPAVKTDYTDRVTLTVTCP